MAGFKRSILVVLAMFALAAVPLWARGEASEATLRALVSGFGPVQERNDAGMLPVVIRMKGDAVRVDFQGPRGTDGYLLWLGKDGGNWLVSTTGRTALPMPGQPQLLRYDPESPCARLGGVCERVDVETVAGRPALAWRYRRAAGRGPDGTDEGTLWLDSRTGMLLGFRGRVAGRNGLRQMRVVSVDYGPVEEHWFELPRPIDTLYEGRGR